VVKSTNNQEIFDMKLSYQARKALPKGQFAIPSERAYPIQDVAHGRNALSRVAAYGTPFEKKKVRAAVHRRYPEIGKRKAA